MQLEELIRQLRDSNCPPRVLGREEYVQTAVLLPLFKKEGEWHLLFEVRADHIPQGGEVCFPGGRLEEQDKGDSSRCALRETCEELGVDAQQVQVLAPLGCEISLSGMLVDAWVGYIEVPAEADLPCSEEVSRVFSLPLDFFIKNPPRVYQVAAHFSPFLRRKGGAKQTLLPSRELRLPRRYHTEWGHQLLNVYAWELSDVVIWGLTARLIRHLVGLLAPSAD